VPLLQKAGWDDDQNTTVLTAENAEGAEEEAGELHEEPPPYDTLSSSIEERAGVRSRKYYSDGGAVEIAADGKQLCVVKLTDYTADGELQFTLPDVLKVPPISQRGNVIEIACYFGGFEQLGNAVQELQTLLYAK
jgi:hypothetical protein